MAKVLWSLLSQISISEWIGKLMGSEPGPGFPYGGAGLARSVLVGLGLGQSGWVISVLIQKFCFPMFVCLFLEVCISGSLGAGVPVSFL